MQSGGEVMEVQNLTCKFCKRIDRVETEGATWSCSKCQAINVIIGNLPDKQTVSQEIKQTTGKAPLANLKEFHLAFEEVARVRQYGKVKYPNANSWREVPDEELDNAIFRHFFNPNKIDKESGFSHKAHMITNLLFELQKEMELKQCD